MWKLIQAAMWIEGIGFTIALGSMTAKTWRVARIFLQPPSSRRVVRLRNCCYCPTAVPHFTKSCTTRCLFSTRLYQRRWRTGALPPVLSKMVHRGQKCLFIAISSVISSFIKIDLKQNYCSYSSTQKMLSGFL